jgi:hypothetical protein
VVVRDSVFSMGPRHVPTATGRHATMKELLEAVFSMWSAPRLNKE